MTELEDLAQQVRLLRAGDTTEPTDAHDPTAIHVGDPAGGDLTGFYPNPTLATPAVAAPTTRPYVFDPIERDSDRKILSSFNGQGFVQDYTVTDALGNDYILFYNAEVSPWIAKKGPTDSRWATFDLSSVNAAGTPTGTANTSGNPLSAPVTLDGHNFTTFGLDAAGRIHVVGNHHADTQPLHYMKSTNPRDVSAWSGRLDMAGTAVNTTGHVTYPMFHQLPDGTLIFLVRLGSSGDGDTYCLRWNGTDWDDLGQISNGVADNASIYLLPPCVDPVSGAVHLIWNWRTTGAATTNTGFWYAKLTGLQGTGTMAAEDSTGTAITLPVVLPTALGGSGSSASFGQHIADFPAPYLLNDAAPGNMQPCDKDGYPHSSFMCIDPDGNPQHYHIFQDASGWHTDVITEFGAWDPAADWGGSTPAGDASRMKILNTPDGKTLALGYWPGEGRRGALWCQDITPGQPGYVPNTSVASPPSRSQPSGQWSKRNLPFKLHEFSDQGDFHYNFQAVANNQLKILITASSQRFYHDPGIFSNYPGLGAVGTDVPTGWGSPTMENPRGILGLLTIDLAQLDLFKNGQVRLPSIRVESESTGGNIPVPKGTSTFTPAGDLLQMLREPVFVSLTSGGAPPPVTHPANVFVKDPVSGFSTGNDGSGNQPSVIVPSTVSGGILFGRMFVQMRAESGGGFVACCIAAGAAMNLSPSHEQTVNGATANIAGCFNDVTLGSNVTQSSYNDSTIFTTPWVRLFDFDTLGAGNVGRLRLSCRTGGTSPTKGTITSVTIQLGVLDA